jgi:hypothetical protein
MTYDRIVTTFIPGVLIVLAAGCAAQRTGAELNPADSAAAAVATDRFKGTWHGEAWAVGTDSTSVLNRSLTLEVKDDATYRLSSTRLGASSNDSGSVTREGDAMILRSSSGQWIRLTRNGDKLYGVFDSSGRRMQIMLERAQ